MNHQPEVQLFIMSYKRAELLREALESALNQTYPNLKIIVSENSPDLSVVSFLNKVFTDQKGLTKTFEIRKRHPSLDSHKHFKTVIKEVTAPYFMIFHDDDVMQPCLVSELVTELETQPQLSCAAGNAYLIKNTEKTNLLFNPKLTQDKIFNSAFEFSKHYLDYRQYCLPFPGYLYRNPRPEILCGEPSEGGQYADGIMLTKFLLRGPILWKAKPLMYYRYHQNNDSRHLDMLGAFRLIRSFEKLAGRPKRGSLSLQYIISKLTNYLRFKNKKSKLIRPILFKYFIFHPWFLIDKILTSFKNKIRSAAP